MRLISLIITCCFISCQTSKQASYNTKDTAALNTLSVKWQRYWNIHNMDSMGTLLATNADFINVGGFWMKGKQAAVKDHKEKHQGVKFKTSIWQTDSVAITYVKPDIALMHIGWGISGDFENDGTPRQPRHGLFTWLVQKQDGQWLLLAVQNTNIRDTVTAH
jgi:uncharacterized protein (TIGR02246 family)